MANGSHKLKHRKDSLFIVDSFNYVITCKFQGVLPLPNDRAVRLRSQKWTLRGTHFLKNLAKICKKKWPWMRLKFPNFLKFSIFPKFSKKSTIWGTDIPILVFASLHETGGGEKRYPDQHHIPFCPNVPPPTRDTFKLVTSTAVRYCLLWLELYSVHARWI